MDPATTAALIGGAVAIVTVIGAAIPATLKALAELRSVKESLAAQDKKLDEQSVKQDENTKRLDGRLTQLLVSKETESQAKVGEAKAKGEMEGRAAEREENGRVAERASAVRAAQAKVDKREEQVDQRAAQVDARAEQIDQRAAAQDPAPPDKEDSKP